MAIKMRTVKDPEAVCKICGNTREQSLEIFEIKFTDRAKLQLCDLCNNRLLYKTLSASCKVNNKVKTKKDINIINKRSSKGISDWYFKD